MADKKTLREISSDLVQLNSAIDMPELDEDELELPDELLVLPSLPVETVIP